MSKIGKNIRKIRATKGLSQAAFAEIFNITRASIGAYEEGRAEPKTDIMIQIAKHFSIPIEALLTKELTVNQLTNFKLNNTSDSNQSTSPLLFINNWNWNKFINKEIDSTDFTLQFPENFLNGQIAFEIHHLIKTDFKIGTIIICDPITKLKKNGLYLIIQDSNALILPYNEINSKTKYEAYIINQKLENTTSSPTLNLEERMLQMEKQMEKLISKIKK